MARWQLYYHVVFGVKDREVTLGLALRAAARRQLWAKAEELGCIVHALHVRPDHVHLVLSVPPTRAVSFVVGQVKGASGHGLGTQLPPWVTNVWQESFGVFSFGREALPVVVGYVQEQDRRHAERDVWGDWERWDAPAGGWLGAPAGGGSPGDKSPG